jgi:hypothetical protein
VAQTARALRAHEVYGRYLTTDARGRLTIDRDKVRAEERWTAST